jgi:hypothetical protein
MSMGWGGVRWFVDGREAEMARLVAGMGGLMYRLSGCVSLASR